MPTDAGAGETAHRPEWQQFFDRDVERDARQLGGASRDPDIMQPYPTPTTASIDRTPADVGVGE